MTNTSKLKGKTFRSVVNQDCNCLWEVKRSRGSGVFECEVVDEPYEVDGTMHTGEYAGRRQVFTREEIERHILLAELFEKGQKEHTDFYNGLELGSIVHYYHSAGAFIRCEVVVAGEPEKLDHPCVEQGERALRQVALVGKWRDEDLRFSSYHAKRLDYLFIPNASCIYENPSSKNSKRHGDPTAMRSRMGLTDCASDIPSPEHVPCPAE